MPRDKDLKRLVRARMEKTGESYTAARSRIVGKTPKKAPTARGDDAAPESTVASASAAERTHVSAALEETSEPATAQVQPADYAKVAGMKDDTLKLKTGCDWATWVYALDRRRAYEMSHREIADIVNQKYGVDGWWSQMVTVGYERIKKLRETGQRRGGAFEASKTRTFHVPVERLYDAWALKRQRRRWLTDGEAEVRSATRPKSMRLALEDGTSAVLWFVSKGDEKSSVSVQHMGLPDRAAIDRSKKLWGERLDALGELLGRR